MSDHHARSKAAADTQLYVAFPLLDGLAGWLKPRPPGCSGAKSRATPSRNWRSARQRNADGALKQRKEEKKP